MNTTVMSARSIHSMTQSWVSGSSWKHRRAKLETSEFLEEIWRLHEKSSLCTGRTFKTESPNSRRRTCTKNKTLTRFFSSPHSCQKAAETVSKQEIKYCTIIRIQQHYHVLYKRLEQNQQYTIVMV